VEPFFPLYDNGRSLFYEDTEDMVLAAVEDPSAYATTFVYVGTYRDNRYDGALYWILKTMEMIRLLDAG